MEVDKVKLLEEEKSKSKSVKKKKLDKVKFSLISISSVLLTILLLCLVIYIYFIRYGTKEYFCESKDGENFVEIKSVINANALSRKNRALKMEVDNVCSVANCFADLEFTEDDIQNKLDNIIGHLLLNEKYKWSTALAKTQVAFKNCYNHLSNNATFIDKTLVELYGKLMEIEAFVDSAVKHNVGLSQGLTEIVLQFWTYFGVDVLFRLRTADTFTNKEVERQSLVYVEQKTLPKFNEKLLNLQKKAEHLIKQKSGQSDLIQFITHFVNSDLLTTKYDDNPLKWNLLNIDEANKRWPFFNFSLYFRDLDFPRNNFKDGEEMKFVVKSVDYLDALNDRFTENPEFAYYLLFNLGFYITLSEYEPHLMKIGETKISHDEKIQRCAAEVRQQLPLIASRIFVDNLDEIDLELRIQGPLTVYQVFTQIWTQPDAFMERGLSTEDVNEVNKHLLPTKFFGVDHGYVEDEKYFDWLHRRLNLNENQSIIESLVEMRRFNRLRSILCLSKPENAKCGSYYSDVSCATTKITYLERDHTIILPVGLMLLLQEVYDEHAESMDHHSRFEKMMSTLKCLIRQALKQRMTKSALLWDDDGRLFKEKELEHIQHLPKVFKCDQN